MNSVLQARFANVEGGVAMLTCVGPLITVDFRALSS